MLEANAFLALAAAVLWGGGDFSGGMGAKQAGGTMAGALRVVLTSHAASFCVLVAIASVRGDSFPHGAPLLWGLLAGVMGGLSLTGFYIALSRGAMGVSAAISGLLAAAIPAAISIAGEGSPGWQRIAGFVVAGASIWIIAAGDNPEAKPVSRGTTWLAILSGAGFGVYFTALKFAGVAGVVWPMATARIGSLTTCSLLLVITLAREKTRVGCLARPSCGRSPLHCSIRRATCSLSPRREPEGWTSRQSWPRFIQPRRSCWRPGCSMNGRRDGRALGCWWLRPRW